VTYKGILGMGAGRTFFTLFLVFNDFDHSYFYGFSYLEKGGNSHSY
jgi:hypothetical protein